MQISLYSENDPYFQSTQAISPFHDKMPTKKVWEAILNSQIYPEQYYTDEDSWYTTTEELSSFSANYPNPIYWETFINFQNEFDLNLLVESFSNKEKVGQFQLAEHEFIKNIKSSDLQYLPNPESFPTVLSPEFVEQLSESFCCQHMSLDLSEIIYDQNSVDISSSTVTTHDIPGFPLLCNQNTIDTIQHKRNIIRSYPYSPFYLMDIKQKSHFYEFVFKEDIPFLNPSFLELAEIGKTFDDLQLLPYPPDPIFDDEEDNPENRSLFYFLDIEGSPGAFSQFIFWRLNDKSTRDLPVGKGISSQRWSIAFIQNLCQENNQMKKVFEQLHSQYKVIDMTLDSINDYIKEIDETKGQVNFAVAGASESPCGENEQDYSSLLLKECYIALSCLKEDGNFVVRLYGAKSAFTITLLYALATCFQSSHLFRPNIIQPASKRFYFVGTGMKSPKQIKNVIDAFQEGMTKTNGMICNYNDLPKTFTDALLQFNDEMLDLELKGIDMILWRLMYHTIDYKYLDIFKENLAKDYIYDLKIPKFENVQKKPLEEKVDEISPFANLFSKPAEERSDLSNFERVQKIQKDDEFPHSLLGERFTSTEHRDIIKIYVDQPPTKNLSETNYIF